MMINRLEGFEEERKKSFGSIVSENLKIQDKKIQCTMLYCKALKTSDRMYIAGRRLMAQYS